MLVQETDISLDIARQVVVDFDRAEFVQCLGSLMDFRAASCGSVESGLLYLAVNLFGDEACQL